MAYGPIRTDRHPLCRSLTVTHLAAALPSLSPATTAQSREHTGTLPPHPLP